VTQIGFVSFVDPRVVRGTYGAESHGDRNNIGGLLAAFFGDPTIGKLLLGVYWVEVHD